MNGPEARPSATRRLWSGMLAGGGVLVGAMALVALVAAVLGWIDRPVGGPVDLGPWLRLEIGAGLISSVLAGWVCRRVSGGSAASAWLALATFAIGAAEATELLRHDQAGRIEAPLGLVAFAPAATALGILIGGVRVSPAGWAVWLGKAGFARRCADAWRYAVPASVLVSAALVSTLALPERPEGPRATVVASALTMDFTLSAPVLVYLLLVRTRRLPGIVLAPTLLLGYALASWTIPTRHQGLLEALRWLLIPGELALLAYLFTKARRALAGTSSLDGDFVTRFRSAARDSLGSRFAAGVLATEIGVLYHAFRPRSSSPQPGSFTCHRETGYRDVVLGLSMVLMIETVALHLLVSRWSVAAAWVLSGLSLYALIWFLGDYRAFADRPIRISNTHLRLRVGLRWEADVPLERIAEVRVGPPIAERSGDALTAVVIGRPNLLLRLRSPIEVTGMYGLRKTTRALWLQVDQAAKLERELRAVTKPTAP